MIRFFALFLGLVVLSDVNAEEPKRFSLGLGVELLGFEHGSYWNLGDLSYTSPEKVDYERFNDRVNLLSLSGLASYQFNSFVSGTLRLGIGSKNLDGGRSVLVENPGKTLSKIFTQTYTCFSASLGAKLTLIDISLLGSDRKDFSLRLAGDIGFYSMSVKGVDSGLVQDANLFIYSEDAQSMSLTFAPGFEIVALGSVGFAAYFTSLLPVEGIPSKIVPLILKPASVYVCYYF